MIAAPRSEQELLERAATIAGAPLLAIAARVGIPPPADISRAKGWVGELIEIALGATGGSRPVPDFEGLGIELKTIPVNAAGAPQESTYICMVPLRHLPGRRWEDSVVCLKLRRVLWVPVDTGTGRGLPERRVGTPFLWSPSSEQEAVLRADWEEHMELIVLGQLGELDARLGKYLQVRPKAMDGSALTAATNEFGEPEATLPRGFYLRSGFTREILRCGG